MDKNLKSEKKKKGQSGEEQLEGHMWSYIVQEKLGDTLENYLFKKDEPFSEKTTLQVGIQLLDSLKMIHEAGFTFNDLKLDNVLIGDAQELPEQMDSLHKIRIIDFGLAKKYVDANGQHIQQTGEKLFQGNMIFASKNAFNMKTQSRRDDLISLCYFLLYLVDGDLTFLQNGDDDDQSQKEEFSRIKKMKNMLTPEMLCAESDEGRRLQPFLEEIFKLEFDQTPNYDKLRFTLVKGLLNLNETPNKEYDWNADHLKQQKRQVNLAPSDSEDSTMSSTDEGISYNAEYNMNHRAMKNVEAGKGESSMNGMDDIDTSPMCKADMK